MIPSKTICFLLRAEGVNAASCFLLTAVQLTKEQGEREVHHGRGNVHAGPGGKKRKG